MFHSSDFSFENLKKLQFIKKISWGKSFPNIKSFEDCNKLVQVILNFKKYSSKPIEHIGSIQSILLENISNINEINELIKKSDFNHAIYIVLKSKILAKKLDTNGNEIKNEISRLDYDQQNLIKKILESFVSHQKWFKEMTGLTQDEYKKNTIDNSIKLLLFRKTLTLKEFNEQLKNNKSNYGLKALF